MGQKNYRSVGTDYSFPKESVRHIMARPRKDIDRTIRNPPFTPNWMLQPQVKDSPYEDVKADGTLPDYEQPIDYGQQTSGDYGADYGGMDYQQIGDYHSADEPPNQEPEGDPMNYGSEQAFPDGAELPNPPQPIKELQNPQSVQNKFNFEHSPPKMQEPLNPQPVQNKFSFEHTPSKMQEVLNPQFLQTKVNFEHSPTKMQQAVNPSWKQSANNAQSLSFGIESNPDEDRFKLPDDILDKKKAQVMALQNLSKLKAMLHMASEERRTKQHKREEARRQFLSLVGDELQLMSSAKAAQLAATQAYRGLVEKEKELAKADVVIHSLRERENELYEDLTLAEAALADADFNYIPKIRSPNELKHFASYLNFGA